jgi:hypothetical protein
MSTFFEKTVGLFISFKNEKKYFVYMVKKSKDKVVLHYFIDDWTSSWVKIKDTFDKFPQKYEVKSGYWDCNKDRFSFLIRIVCEIKCEGLKEFTEQNISR